MPLYCNGLSLASASWAGTVIVIGVLMIRASRYEGTCLNSYRRNITVGRGAGRPCGTSAIRRGQL